MSKRRPTPTATHPATEPLGKVFDALKELAASGLAGRRRVLTGRRRKTAVKLPPELRVDSPTDNVFCPTGPGGGADPKCGKTGAHAGDAKDFYERLPDSAFGDVPVDVPIELIHVSKSLVKRVKQDIKAGKVSKNPSRPVELYYDTKAGQILVVDGAHRLMEAHAAGKETIKAVFEAGEGHEAVKPVPAKERHVLVRAPTHNESPNAPDPLHQFSRFLFSTNKAPTQRALADAVYELMDDVTKVEATTVARAVLQGYAGDAPVESVAKELRRKLGFDDTRANVVAVTETTRVRASDDLGSAAESGLTSVKFRAHAGACEDCQRLNGREFSLTEAQHKIPVHPHCGCGWNAEDVRPTGNEITQTDNRSYFGDCPRDDAGRCLPSGEAGATLAPKGEVLASAARAVAKVNAAPVPDKDKVGKMRDALARAKADPKARHGGDARGNSTDRRRRALALFKEFGGGGKGYVVCPWTGIKMHWAPPTDKANNPKGYPKFEQGKIFVACQGGSYLLDNLIPESFTANRKRNDARLRKENSRGC